MNVVVLDPALENVNAGDSVISQAIQKIPGLGVDDVERLTTHRLLRLSESNDQNLWMALGEVT